MNPQAEATDFKSVVFAKFHHKGIKLVGGVRIELTFELYKNPVLTIERTAHL